MAVSAAMTRRDRDQLAQVAKMRARVAKSSIEQRELVLRSQVEDELKGLFDAEEEMAIKAAGVAVAEAQRADKDLQERLAEYEIPEHLRPHLVAEMIENQMMGKRRTIAQRRMELSGIATSRIKALGAQAKVEIDSQCADTVSALITGGFDGEEAQRYLDSMPTIDQLMLAPSIAELEAVHDEQRRKTLELRRGWS